MIGRLEGQVRHLEPGLLIVGVGGVGYLVSTSIRAFEELEDEAQATLWIHTRVREDGIVLYGFLNRRELAAFERLLGVVGVGPRIALAVLSYLTPTQLAEAVEAGDFPRLQRAPGIGRKTAERIVLELKGRLGDDAVGSIRGGDPRSDAISALVNLGYSERDAIRAVNKVAASAGTSDLAALLRLALQALTG